MKRKRLACFHDYFAFFSIFLLLSIHFFIAPQLAGAADKTKVKFMSLPEGGSVYTAMVAFSQLINKKSDLECFVEPVPSPIAEVTFVNEGKGDVFSFAYDACYDAYKGLGGTTPGLSEGFEPYKGKPNLNLRLLLGGESFFWTMFTTPKTNIKTISDLKGKKIAGHFPGWNISNYTKVMLMAYGLDPEKDAKILTFPRSSLGTTALMDGLVDAAVDTPTGGPSLEMASKMGLWILPVDPSKIDFIKKVSPVAVITKTPSYVAGYSAQGPVDVIAVQVNLMANKNLSDNAAYTIVKTICENKADLARMGGRLDEYNIDRGIIPNFMIPYHPGAIRYFKEKGVWKEGLEKVQDDVLKENDRLLKAMK